MRRPEISPCTQHATRTPDDRDHDRVGHVVEEADRQDAEDERASPHARTRCPGAARRARNTMSVAAMRDIRCLDVVPQPTREKQCTAVGILTGYAARDRRRVWARMASAAPLRRARRSTPGCARSSRGTSIRRPAVRSGSTTRRSSAGIRASESRASRTCGRLGPFEDEWLRGGPVQRWVPRGLAGKPVFVFETGGTTGMPKTRIACDDFRTDYELFSARCPTSTSRKGRTG